MDLNRVLVYLSLMVFVFGVLFANVTGIQLLVLALLTLAVIVVARRAYFFFVKANRIYSSHDKSRLEEAMVWYRKTLRAGISPKYTVLCATILIQEGDKETGKAALEKLLATRSVKDETIRSQAKCALSLAYYVDEDYEKALSLCKEVMDGKYRDNVLYIDICTYYLALGKVKDFKRTVEDFSQKTVTSAAMLDLQIVYQLLSGQWKSAFVMLSQLFDKADGDFTFADPYVHMAQVWIHYGDHEKALEYLRTARDRIDYRAVTIISKDFVEALISGLENEETRHQMMADIDSDMLSVINGKKPKHFEGEWRSHDGKELENAQAEAVRQVEADREELADRDPNTDLDDADEEWLKRHQD